MKPSIYKRIIAYLLDLIIVAIISNLLTINIYNSKQYQDANNEYNNLLHEFSNGEITEEEFFDRSNDVAYTLSKESIVVTIVSEVIIIISYVVVPYFMNGQTLGKKIMKLRIVSNSNKEITMNNYLIRGLLINLILVNLISIVTILFLDKNMYLTISDIVTKVFSLFYMVSVSMVVFKDDRRGLHDIIAGTKVIDIKNKEEVVSEVEEKKENEDSKLKDAEIIGEKNLKM